MIIANKYEVPDVCPKDCKFGDVEFQYQGSICHRCPIFNCGTHITQEGECVTYPESDVPFRLLEPEDYREDWAKEWVKFFKDGSDPILKLERSEDDTK